MKLSILVSLASLALSPAPGVANGLVTRSENGQQDIHSAQEKGTSCHGVDNPQDPSVKLRDNLGVVHGKISPSAPCVRQFLGIPYAEPPLGKLRFAPPQRAGPLGDLDARNLPPSCMQYLMKNPPDIYTRDVLGYNLQGLNTTGSVSEDCLTLSIWTPVISSNSTISANSTGGHESAESESESSSDSESESDSDSDSDHESHSRPFPVLLFIFGGAFVMGGEDVPYQIPTNWVERTQDHIVVTFNYRLNIFGFPNAAGLPLSERNLGLLDQRLAVEWVRDNIAAFGGDPTRITLWGQSAGGISTGYYQYAYPKDPIISGTIMDSGTEMLGSPLFSDPDNSNFTYVARRFGCGASDLNKDPSTETAEQRLERGRHEVECMRGANVSAKAIEDFIQQHDEALQVPYIFFAPQVDNRTVFPAAEYAERSKRGEIAKVPSIIGTNAQDGVAFVYLTPEGVNSTMAYAVTLGVFFCTAYAAVKNRLLAPANSVPVFRYVYEGNFTNLSPKPYLGAYHSSELPLIFGTYDEFRAQTNNASERSLLRATSHAMQDAWVAFAAGGAKGVEEWGWPRYTGVPGRKQVEIFGMPGGSPRRVGSTAAEDASCPAVAVPLRR